MTPREPIDSIIDNAASQLTSANPSSTLRASVMSRVAAERRPRFVWRYVFAGGALAAIAIVSVASFRSADGRISDTPIINTPIINASKTPAQNPTGVEPPTSPLPSVERVAARTAAVTMSTAEMEWRARATPALDQPDPMEVRALELKSIDIAPLGVAPLVVPALGDGQNR
jgi:hypothetical protein